MVPAETAISEDVGALLSEAPERWNFNEVEPVHRRQLIILSVELINIRTRWRFGEAHLIFHRRRHNKPKVFA